jgi:hypothetical protein
MDPKKGPVKISQREAAGQMAAAQALKVPPRSQSPVGGSSDDDEPTGSEWIWSQTKDCMRKDEHFRAPDATAVTKEQTTSAPTAEPVSAPKAPQQPSTPSARVGTVVVPQDTAPTITKGKAPTRANKGAGKKAAAKPAVSEATQPMGTRSNSKEASRAGRLRPGVGGLAWACCTRQPFQNLRT